MSESSLVDPQENVQALRGVIGNMLFIKIKRNRMFMIDSIAVYDVPKQENGHTPDDACAVHAAEASSGISGGGDAHDSGSLRYTTYPGGASFLGQSADGGMGVLYAVQLPPRAWLQAWVVHVRLATSAGGRGLARFGTRRKVAWAQPVGQLFTLGFCAIQHGFYPPPQRQPQREFSFSRGWHGRRRFFARDPARVPACLRRWLRFGATGHRDRQGGAACKSHAGLHRGHAKYSRASRFL